MASTNGQKGEFERLTHNAIGLSRVQLPRGPRAPTSYNGAPGGGQRDGRDAVSDADADAATLPLGHEPKRGANKAATSALLKDLRRALVGAASSVRRRTAIEPSRVSWRPSNQDAVLEEGDSPELWHDRRSTPMS